MTFEEMTAATERLRQSLPWPRPNGVWETDGPEEMKEFTLRGVVFRVTPTDDTGIDTGRRRMKVECVTCGELLHRGTTGASHRIISHLTSSADPHCIWDGQ